MKNMLHMLAVVTLAFGLIACDHVVLPGGGGTGGGQGDPWEDSTGTGGGDDSTGNGGGRNTDTNFVISIGGPIGDQRGQIAAAPDGATIVVLWQTGRGDYIVFGQGSLSSDRTEWSLDVNLSPLPEEALFTPDGSQGVHGIGTPMMVMGEYDDGATFTTGPNGDVGIAYIPGNVQLVYNTGREKMTPWSSPWIVNFDVGYTVARAGFTGWVPIEETTFPMFLRR